MLGINHDYNDLSRRAIQMIAQYNFFNVPIEKTSHLVRDIGIDSLSLVELVEDLEKEFNIKISDVEMASAAYFSTVERLVTFIDRKLKEIQISDNLF